MHHKYIFGPVPSRRLGISLGVDLVPLKTCSYNCIYCECGRTTNLTTQRKEYVSSDDVIRELDCVLKNHPPLDYITYAGSGEPTLNRGIGKITAFLKKNYPEYKIALLTNGSLFTDEEVRRECMDIDLVIPSLDSAKNDSFRLLDRPHSSLDVDSVNRGIIDFSREFRGKIWMEIFVVSGINTTDAEINAINRVIEKIKPEKIQLNTLDRPGAVDWIRAADDRTMTDVKNRINHDNVEIAGKPAERIQNKAFLGDIMDLILQTIARRPCTIEDICSITSLHMNEVNKYLSILEEKDLIIETKGERGIFYSVK
ncbi:wyosine [tRNA(Phe)-imidazoG37] synthetase (radical SAM superfamily) [Methanomicrobium sp. W14]|uniref:radical SAM protein n=1 Tax=Methanomicrobium sp. W14 TaxID=2817839 RepID=UPI001AE9679E|nr:radical SAM protein [Methanomicrobium sp. W14]MBP2132627.1 wyosine [tRNA(Phe)-imidazoG37] synthetase (radical SAM superfamily) [Methanomicrobium sp. W14]